MYFVLPLISINSIKCFFTNHIIIYIKKQDIRNLYTYVPYSRPNGWTEWADTFCGHSWVAWGGH